MKEFQIESFSSTHESGKTVKSRKDFTCQCCELTFPKGTIAQTFKCVNGTDFFEMKFCTECKENIDFKIITSWN